MAEILTKVIVNCETGETQVLPLTEEEIAQKEADAAVYAAQKSEEDAVKAARAAAKASAEAKLASLGLTDEEIAALR
jgi:hypothetical protein